MTVGMEWSGDFEDMERWLRKSINIQIFDRLKSFGEEGVRALEAGTPVNSRETANSWTYEIVRKKNDWSIIWSNTNVVNGVNIAVLLQHGHATRNGGWVPGRDYINPALEPVMKRMSEAGWRLITND